MKFHQATLKKYFKSQRDLLENRSRRLLFEQNSDRLIKFLDSLEIEYDVNDIFLVNEGLETLVYELNKLPVLFEMTFERFEDLVDGFVLDEYKDIIDVYCRTERGVYHWEEDGQWKISESPDREMSVKKLIYES